MACSIRNRLADLHGTPSNRSPFFIYRRQLVVSHPIRNQSNGNAITPGLNTCRNSLHFQRISYTWHSCTNMSIQCSRSSFTDRSAQPAYTELTARSQQKRELNCETKSLHCYVYRSWQMHQFVENCNKFTAKCITICTNMDMLHSSI